MVTDAVMGHERRIYRILLSFMAIAYIIGLLTGLVLPGLWR